MPPLPSSGKYGSPIPRAAPGAPGLRGADAAGTAGRRRTSARAQRPSRTGTSRARSDHVGEPSRGPTLIGCGALSSTLVTMGPTAAELRRCSVERRRDMTIDCPRPARRPSSLTSWSTSSDVSRRLHAVPEHPSFPDDFITDAYRYVPPHDDLSDVDARFVFDFRTYDDLDDGQRWSTWLNVEPLMPWPRAAPRLGGDLAGRDRHRARHPQDRQGGRRLPASSAPTRSTRRAAS